MNWADVVAALVTVGKAGLLLLMGLIVCAACAYASWHHEQRGNR